MEQTDYVVLMQRHQRISIAPLSLSVLAAVLSMTVLMALPAVMLSLGALLCSYGNRRLAMKKCNIPECGLNRAARYIAVFALAVSLLLVVSIITQMFAA